MYILAHFIVSSSMFQVAKLINFISYELSVISNQLSVWKIIS
jgi:hypothetical protein